MNLDLLQKVVLVTGGAKGIGASIARSFAEEGAVPVILGRNREEAAALVAELGEKSLKADSVHMELVDEAQVEAGIRSVVERHGRIDIVVNNAGVNDSVGLDAGVGSFRESLEKSLVHYYSVVHFALGELKKSKGAIVNIGSKVAETGQGKTSGYAAAKSAINGLTREWAVDLAPHGIRVNCVVTAEAMTPMYRRWLDSLGNPSEALGKIESSIPLGRRMTTAEEIADTVVFVASSKASHTTGQILYVDGGYTHFDRKCTLDNE